MVGPKISTDVLFLTADLSRWSQQQLISTDELNRLVGKLIDWMISLPSQPQPPSPQTPYHTTCGLIGNLNSWFQQMFSTADLSRYSQQIIPPLNFNKWFKQIISTIEQIISTADLNKSFQQMISTLDLNWWSQQLLSTDELNRWSQHLISTKFQQMILTADLNR